DPDGMKLGFEALERAIVVGDKLTEPALPLISHRVSQHGIEELTRPGSARTLHSPRCTCGAAPTRRPSARRTPRRPRPRPPSRPSRSCAWPDTSWFRTPARDLRPPVPS